MELPSREPRPEEVTGELLKYPDRIAETFKDKTIFLTGGTGLIGKVFIDKILRCSRDVRRIYVLVRSKKGKSSEERIEELFKNPLYNLLKRDATNNFRPKVIAIPGDVCEDALGISQDDRKRLIDEVDIVVHSAASVRFDEPFKKMVLLNVRGSKYMLDLANEMKRLQLYFHVSTAYAHTKEKVLEEKTYKPPANPHNILKLVEILKEDILNAITKDLMDGYPNTYAFTKALAEGLVNEELEKGKLPIIIIRPSVVVPIFRHPMPGWSDNMNGPAGLLIAAGKGVLRTMYMPSPDGCADFVPVDIAINGFCVAAHAYLNNPSKRKEYSVLNLTTSSIVTISWKEMIRLGRDIVRHKLPFNWIAWYPGGETTKSYILHTINFYSKQYIPAVIVDSILYCLGIKPVLMRVQKRIQKGYEVFSYYTDNEWVFVNEKLLSLRDQLNPREVVTYRMDDDGLDFEEYFTNAIAGSRRYLLNESDESVATARRHSQIMYVIDKLFLVCLFLGLINILYKLYLYVFAS